jgi:hypothetical protein
VEYFNKFNFNSFAKKSQNFSLTSPQNLINFDNNLNTNSYFDNFFKLNVLNKAKFYSEPLFTNSELLSNNVEKFSSILPSEYSIIKKTNIFVFNFFEDLFLNNKKSNLITHMDLEENSR